MTHQEDASASLLHPIHWIGLPQGRIGQTLTQILSRYLIFNVRNPGLIMDEIALDRLVVYAGMGAGLRLMPRASSAPAIASAPAIRKARA